MPAGDHTTVCVSSEDTVSHFYLTLPELVAGSAAGFVEHFALFPLDTIKTRIQSGISLDVASELRRVWNTERFVYLYRGFFPIIVSAVPAHGAYFGVYEAAKRVLGEESNLAIAASASCAVTAHDAITTPFDVVKQRMQVDKKREFASSLSCARQVVMEEGVRALVVSLPTTIMMNAPHFATYWLVYEGFLAYLGGAHRRRENELAVDYVVAGLLAGGMASFISSPLDIVKTQLQLGNAAGFRSAVRNILFYRGIRGFFAGVSARIMYSAPSGALTMITYEMIKRTMEGW